MVHASESFKGKIKGVKGYFVVMSKSYLLYISVIGVAVIYSFSSLKLYIYIYIYIFEPDIHNTIFRPKYQCYRF